MLNDENAPIRYLMKEMDPSEELLMERAMMEDDDLLIEVESLRQTLKRLDKLPEKDPPPQVAEAVMEYAAQKAEERNASRYFSFQPLKYAAAAVVLFGVSLGSFLVYEQLGEVEEGIGADVTPRAETTQSRADVSDMAVPSLNIATFDDGQTDPWVDKSDVIYFQDQFNSRSAEFDSMLKNSMQKLTPLSSPSFYNPQNRAIQMTGTGIRQ